MHDQNHIKFREGCYVTKVLVFDTDVTVLTHSNKLDLLSIHKSMKANRQNTAK